MKILPVLFLLTATAAFAQSPSTATPSADLTGTAPTPIVAAGSFPGLKIAMTPEEFSKAGLDALTPEQLDLINLAVSRHYDRTIAKQVEILTSVQTKTHAHETEEAVAQAVAEEKQKSWLSHVGLPEVLNGEWKNEPSIKGTCTGWVTGNSFRLDNGQVWEGVDPIRMEISGREIEIQSRPNGGFDLYVDGKNTRYRIYRVK